jgi:hypothetical protein
MISSHFLEIWSEMFSVKIFSWLKPKASPEEQLTPLKGIFGSLSFDRGASRVTSTQTVSSYSVSEFNK